jgi:hypothetical protein
MDWLALLAKLTHVILAIGFAAGLLGRWVLLTRAARTDNVERAHVLAEAASPFERIVQVVSPLVVVVGMATAWAQGYPWLGLTTGWMLLTVLLIVPIVAAVPLVFLPRGRVFEAEMAAARAAGVITPGLRAAQADPVVAMARRYELGALVAVVALMVLKPF